jgi:hypothetical protein
VDPAEGGVDVGIVVLVKDVKCRSQGAGENGRVLRDDGEAAAKVGETDLADVFGRSVRDKCCPYVSGGGTLTDTIDNDTALVRLDKSEETQRESRLAAAGSTDHAYLLARSDLEGDPVQHIGELRLGSVNYDDGMRGERLTLTAYRISSFSTEIPPL